MAELWLREVSVRFGGLQALSAVDLRVTAGRVHGLIGPNGAGKTTLFNVGTGLVAPSGGRVLLDGADITGEPPHVRARMGLARTFQRVEVCGTLTVRENVQLAVEARRGAPGGPRAAAEADRLLATLGIGHLADEPADAVPIGFARLVEIARAVATGPKIVLLDEPSSGLDQSETAALAAVLRRLAAEGMGVLLVEHDMRLVMDLCDELTVLDAGRTVAAGDPATVRADPAVQAAYLGSSAATDRAAAGAPEGAGAGAPELAGAGAAELAGAGAADRAAAGAPDRPGAGAGATPVARGRTAAIDGAVATGGRGPGRDTRGGSARADAVAGRAAGGAGATPVARGRTAAIDGAVATGGRGPGRDTVVDSALADAFAGGTAAGADDPVLSLAGVRAAYGRIEVLHGVTLDVRRGAVVALLGPNGAGKSTLLKCCSGQLTPTGGTVRVFGRPVGHRTPAQLARQGLCAVPEGRAVFANLTVADNLLMSTYRGPSLKRGDVEEKAYATFPRLGQRRTQLAGTLSGGEQQMLAMARALTTDPELLLVDELSMGLAPLIVEELYQIVARLSAERGLTVLLVEQFAEAALALATEAAVLAGGAIVRRGTPAEVAEEVVGAYLGG